MGTKQQEENNRKKKAISAGVGSHCPVCDKKMERRKHPEGWLPKPNQPYYFRLWDYCKNCNRTQHSKSSMVFINQETKEKPM